jgi:GAF domain-containing protein
MVEREEHDEQAEGLPLSEEQARLDEDDLQVAVQGLAALTMGATLEAALERIAVFAVRAIPGADGAGVTMLENTRPATVVVSAPFVRQIDDIQYGLGEGPCITAAAEGRTVMSGALGQDAAWPRFGPRARELGVHSVVSLPLLLEQDVVGALNVYAHGFEVFDAHAAQLGELFAVPAAVAVFNARTLMQARRVGEALQNALTSRAMIDQAIGILRSRQGSTAEEAFDSLRIRSQDSNVKLTAVAQAILDEAVARARARRGRPDLGPPVG